MNTICLYIDETLDSNALQDLQGELQNIPHVHHVIMNVKQPHEVAIEFDAHHNVPVNLLNKMAIRGLHTDIISC